MLKIINSVDQAQAVCTHVRDEGKRLGLVPTMGALHEGHLSLVRAARSQCQVVAASIFVNPLQFGPNEDFQRYPRDLQRDCDLLEKEGVALVFAPPVEEMYPSRCSGGAATSVEVRGLSEKLEGKTRPGHFRGVTTVVNKLFNILGPDTAYFGQKDAQQAIIIRRMVRDLNMPVRVIVCPIVREPDGLAMSSRNVYLTAAQRQAAPVLNRALMRIRALVDAGERQAGRLEEAGRGVIGEQPLARLDYLEIVDPETLDPVLDVSRGGLVVTAAYFGETRLIDNLEL